MITRHLRDTTKTDRDQPAAAALLIAVGLALLLAGAGCTPADAPSPEAGAAMPPASVTVSAPKVQDVTEYAEYTGRTVAIETVEIRARVEGILETIHFTPGARIRKGDLLFSIERAPFEARLNEAKAALIAREAELSLAEATLERRVKAFEKRAVSEVDVIAARSERDAAKAAIEGARAAVVTAELDLSYTAIHAPVGGRTGRNLVDAGNLVGAGERTLLATIVNDDRIYAYFNVNERDLLRLRDRGALCGESTDGSEETDGTEDRAKTIVHLRLSDRADEVATGHVDFVDHSVDPGMGTVEVRAIFRNTAHRIVPGLFARVRFPVDERKDALLVPEIALQRDQRGTFLLVVGEGEIAEARIVLTGTSKGPLRVIKEGIDPDDRVILNVTAFLRPGMPVAPRTEDEQPKVGGPQG